MGTWDAFIGEWLAQGAAPVIGAAPPRIAAFGSVESEYHSLADGPALVDRTDRGLLEIGGADRATWLHNLTTNQVKTLSSDEGNYAFAVNVQGRILFDLNIIVRPESIWIDLDRGFLNRAMTHFAKYTIIEDVTVVDRTSEFVRLGLVGQRSKALLTERGVPHAATMPFFAVAEARWVDTDILILRHDFCGPFSVELFVPAKRAVKVWRALTEDSHHLAATPVGDDAVEIRRVEAGIPRPFREITDEYLPAETGQFDRAVSFNKGCYLGQEVVERMRSRGVVARQLVGLRIKGETRPPQGATLESEPGQVVGIVTSSCRSAALGATIALGYVKSAHAATGVELTARQAERSFTCTVADLPFIPASSH